MGVVGGSLDSPTSQPFGSLARLAGHFYGAPRSALATRDQGPGLSSPTRTTRGHPLRRGLVRHPFCNAGEVERLRLRLLGVGAMASPRYAPAGLLVLGPSAAVMLDGGLTAVPDRGVAAWLVTDDEAELIADIRRSASRLGVRPEVGEYAEGSLVLRPHPVTHTSHPTWGYTIGWEGRTAVWAPEFWEFPSWARGADLMFADAAGWARPIRFRGGVGGHAAALDTAVAARKAGVRRLVLAHIGRPTIRALDAGEELPFGEVGREGADYLL